MKEFSLLFFFIFFCLGVQGQSQDKGNVFVTGVVCDRDSIRPLPEAIFRLGKEVRGVDKQGRFSLSVQVGDTLRFSHIGYVPMQVVIPDSLRENDFLLGVFMVRDTVLLSEVNLTAFPYGGLQIEYFFVECPKQSKSSYTCCVKTGESDGSGNEQAYDDRGFCP